MRDDIRKRIEAVRRGEAPEGYIHSHGYTIPSEWNVVPFGSVFKRSTRKNKSGCENVLTISAQHGLVSQRDYYDKDIASEDKSSYYLMKRGEYAYNKSYSSGYPFGAIKRLEKYEEGIVSPLYICFAPSPNTNTDFYSQYFEGGLYNREIYRFAQEGARNHGLLNIAVEDFFNGVLVAPPEPEQQRIAEILSACDRVIELKHKLVGELQQLKKTCLAKMFPQKGCTVPEIRFPCFTDSWTQRSLSEITIKIGSGKTPSGGKESYVESGVILIRSQNVYADEVDLSDVVFIDADTDSSMANSRVVPDDVLLNITGASIGRSAVYKDPRPANVNQHVCIVRPAKEYDSRFVQLNLSSASGQKQIATSQAGGGREGLNFQQIGKLHFWFPEENEQRTIGLFFDKIDGLISLHQRELEEVQQKKKALMQLLLTGLVRVNA